MAYQCVEDVMFIYFLHIPMNPLMSPLLRPGLLHQTKMNHTGDDLSFCPTFNSAQDLLAFAKKHQATMADFTFVDVPGTLQRTTKPLHELADVIESGAGFDGSSIRGFQQINESDMLLMPDIKTAFLDTFNSEPSIALLCDVKDPISGLPYGNSPRTIAKRAVKALQESGIADTAYFGPEAEFFIFDSVKFDQSAGSAFYAVDSEEAIWNTGKDETQGPAHRSFSEGGNMGYKIRHKEGYFPADPIDRHQTVRTAMVRELEQAGIEIETAHHEVATAGQAEIDLRFADLLSMADNMIRYKYIVRNVAMRFGKTVTFMPKPIYGDNGSGMHVHMSLWNNGQTLFAGDEYAGLSKMALSYIAGLLKHARALCALCNPTTNSYKRLVPGFEAPVNCIYSARNRSAAIRIPMYSQNPKAKRIEFRMPDASCNPYLAFSALLMAGLDGIEKNIDPGAHTDVNLYSLDSTELAKIPHAPHSLLEALDALEADHEFLTSKGVFTEEFIRGFIECKRAEALEENMHPTPSEFFKYYDV